MAKRWEIATLLSLTVLLLFIIFQLLSQYRYMRTAKIQLGASTTQSDIIMSCPVGKSIVSNKALLVCPNDKKISMPITLQNVERQSHSTQLSGCSVPGNFIVNYSCR